MTDRPSPDPISHPLPKYDWAFDAHGEPVHISQAQRGGAYRCPITGQRMVARLGAIKQHHFAYELRPDHDQGAPGCTPEEVARTVGSRWLENALRARRAAGQPVDLTWTCALCGETHRADLLEGVAHIQRRAVTQAAPPDVILVDPTGRTAALVTVQHPGEHQLEALAQQHILVLVVDVAARRHAMVTLDRLLVGAEVRGDMCETRRRAGRLGIVSEFEAVRSLLIAAVNVSPYRLHGPLVEQSGLAHVLVLGERRLWLPPQTWQHIAGGMRHAISPALQIISQEWPQPDGATVALYYVMANGSPPSAAVAVRRFAPDQPVTARLDDAYFRTGRAVADDIARSLAER